ncbi:MAG: glycosyltransferase [Phycisphaerae bacterium]|nr:glycosyltransferase [Phycisphaerae bacterium]
MNTPKISIVTPCLNDARYLEQTLRSIHGQKYSHLEHIVVDGGSTDGSVEIIQSYADRLAWWVSEPDDGHADALWKGMQHVTGDIVTWVCSNDLLLPGSLQAVADYFASHPNVEWAAGHGLAIDEQSRVKARIWSVPFSYWSLMFWLPWGACQPAVFMRRSALEAVGGINRLRHVSVDTELFVRLSQRGRAARIDAFLGALRYHDTSQTNRLAQQVQQADEEIRQQHGLPRLPRLVRRVLYSLYDRRFRSYQWWREQTCGDGGYPVGYQTAG